MKMIKLTSKNLLKHQQLLEQVSEMSLDITKNEEKFFISPKKLKQKDPMKPEDRYYNVGHILSGYYTAYVLCGCTDGKEEHALAMLITNDNNGYANTVSVSFMYVRPQYRGQGIGRELMEKFLSTIPSNTNVMLNCFWENERARKFYEDSGFNRLRATYIRRGAKKKAGKHAKES